MQNCEYVQAIAVDALSEDHKNENSHTFVHYISDISIKLEVTNVRDRV